MLNLLMKKSMTSAVADKQRWLHLSETSLSEGRSIRDQTRSQVVELISELELER
jgi:hypothetical protein